MLSSAIRCTYPLRVGKREESLPLASGWVRQWPVAGLGSDSSEGNHSPLWTCARVVRNSIIFDLLPEVTLLAISYQHEEKMCLRIRLSHK